MTDWLNTAVDRLLFDPVVGKITAAIVGLLFIYIIMRVVRSNLINRRIKQPAVRNHARKILNLVGYVLAFLYVTSVFSDSLGQLTVLFGVLGAGIAFALQEVVTSIAGWAALSLGNFYRSGDRVQLGGIRGDVIDIGLLRTTVVELGGWINGDLYNGRVVRIANSFVFKEPVFNYSADFPFLWDEIVIPVKHGDNRAMAREIITRVVQEVVGDYTSQADSAWSLMLARYAVEDASVEPTVTMIANDNWLEYTVRYVVDYKKRRSTKDVLFNRILDEFDASDGQVNFASATFHLVEAPTVTVKLDKLTQGNEEKHD